MGHNTKKDNVIAHIRNFLLRPRTEKCEELARRLHIPESTIYDIRDGKYNDIEFFTAMKLSGHLGFRISSLASINPSDARYRLDKETASAVFYGNIGILIEKHNRDLYDRGVLRINHKTGRPIKFAHIEAPRFAEDFLDFRQLARYLGFDPKYFSRQHSMRLGKALDICDIFGVPAEDMYLRHDPDFNIIRPTSQTASDEIHLVADQ